MADRDASPTAAIIDSQSVKSTEKGASIDLPGFDGGKKIRGKKRHVLVDTQGLLMAALVHAADIQDRDGGVLLMATLFGMHPFLLKLYADAGYGGPKFRQGMTRVCCKVNVEIVPRRYVCFLMVSLESRLSASGHTRAWLLHAQRGRFKPSAASGADTGRDSVPGSPFDLFRHFEGPHAWLRLPTW